MLNPTSLIATEALRFAPEFVRPDYARYGFARLPDTVRALLGAAGAGQQPLPADTLPGSDSYTQVILVLIDGFGWRFFEQMAAHPVLRALTADGVASRLTAQFPSTTAAELTTLSTGLPPCQSGVYEWFYYDPALDQVIAPLLGTYAGDNQRDRLRTLGIRPAALYPTQTLYADLQAAGVPSYAFLDRAYAYSGFSSATTRGAQVQPYITWAEALVNLEARLRQQRRGYFYLYQAHADSLSHYYGPGLPQQLAEARSALDELGYFLRAYRRVRRRPRTLLLITADHGQVETDPQTTVYLNRRLPGFEKYFRTDRLGRPLLFGGSPRDLFLYVKDECLDEAESILRQALAGHSVVYRTADLLAQGFFGPGPVSERFLARLGNLVLLPMRGQSVSWYVKGRFEQKFYGHHGGLTPDEMYIPLLACEI